MAKDRKKASVFGKTILTANYMGIYFLLLNILRLYVFEMAVNGTRHFEINIQKESYVFNYFPFGFEGKRLELIVSVPDQCLSFYFIK